MKTVLTSGYSFTASAKTLNFSGTSGFDVRRLLAVLNLTRGALVYAVGTAGLGYVALSGSTLTLAFDTTAHANGDALMVLYDAPNTAAQDASLQAILTALGTPALPAGAATEAKVEASRALLATILTTLQAQRSETTWTDDSGAYYIRVLHGDTLLWTDPSGNAATPGTGLRPESDGGVTVARTTFQATAGGTGFVSGDYLDHLVTFSEKGTPLGNFWLNVSQGTKLSAAPANNAIAPSAALPSGAATDAKAEQIRALLAAALTVQGTVTANLGTLNGAATSALQSSIVTALGLLAAAAQLPASLGPKAKAAALAVTTATDDPALAAIAATGPGSGGFAVTPSDSANFSSNARSLYVGVAGDVAVVTPAGTVLLHKNVPAGAILPISASRVNATNTTAASILGYL